MAKSRRDKLVLPRGKYRLNQSAPIFADRRTKRGKDRSTQSRQAIERSLDSEQVD